MCIDTYVYVIYIVIDILVLCMCIIESFNQYTYVLYMHYVSPGSWRPLWSLQQSPWTL